VILIHNVIDGQTDGRTDDMQSQYRALHYDYRLGATVSQTKDCA